MLTKLLVKRIPSILFFMTVIQYCVMRRKSKAAVDPPVIEREK